MRTERLGEAGIAFVPRRPEGVNLSGGLLSLRYRSTTPLEKAIITLKPVVDTSRSGASDPDRDLHSLRRH